MAVEVNLEQLKSLGMSHWKKHLPKLYKNLKASGKLEGLVASAARRTLEAFEQMKKQLIERGWEPGQASESAWEQVREEWLLLPSEKQKGYGERDPDLTQEFFDLAANPTKRTLG